MLRHSAVLLASLALISAPAAADTLTQIPLPANSLAYDERSGLLYASVPGRAGAIGNSIIRINPETEQVVGSVPIGSEPGPLALTEDGQYLYVGLTGAAAVRRYETATHTAGLQWALGQDPWGDPLLPLSLALVPGQPRSIAVREVRGSGSIAVYDDGIPRQKYSPYPGIDQLTTSLSPARLFGSSSGVVARVAVKPEGVTPLSVSGNLLSGSLAAYQRGLAFSTSGRVVDPEGGQILGTCAGLSPWADVSVCPDLPSGRIFFLSQLGGNGSVTLHAFDARTFTLVGQRELQIAGFSAGSLVRWGVDGLAFRTDDAIYLVRTAMVPNEVPTVDLELTSTSLPDESPAGELISYTLTVTNTGDDSATNVTLVDTLLSPNTVASTTVSQGEVFENGGVVTARFGDLEPGASATLTLQVRFLSPGLTQHLARVVAFERDTDETDDQLTGTIDVQAPLGAELGGEWESIKVVCLPRRQCRYTVKLLLRNIGGQHARNFRVRVFLSASSTIDPSHLNTGTEVKVRRVPRGGTASVRVRLRGPFSDPLYLFAVIDYKGQVPEADETDNVVVTSSFND